MRNIILLILLVSVSQPSNANVFNKTVGARLNNIVSPNVIQFRTNFEGASELGLVKVRLPNVEFNGPQDSLCTKSNQDCQTLQNILANSDIQLHLKGVEKGGDVFNGDIYVNGKNLVFKLIGEGFYKFDYKQTRNKYLVLLQKRAMCNGLGIWAVQSITMDKHCN